jgi:hypothetical protein
MRSLRNPERSEELEAEKRRLEGADPTGQPRLDTSWLAIGAAVAPSIRRARKSYLATPV